MKLLRNIFILLHLAVICHSQVFYYDAPSVNNSHFANNIGASYYDSSSQNLYISITGKIQGNQNPTTFTHELLKYNKNGLVVNHLSSNLYNSINDTIFIIQVIKPYKSGNLLVSGNAYWVDSNTVFYGIIDTNLNYISKYFFNTAMNNFEHFVRDAEIRQDKIEIFITKRMDTIIFGKVESYLLSTDTNLNNPVLTPISTPLPHSSKHLFGMYHFSVFDTIANKAKVFFAASTDSTHNYPNKLSYNCWVANIDTSTWICDMNNSRCFWQKYDGSPNLHTASSYSELQTSQFVGYQPYNANQYLIASGMFGARHKSTPVGQGTGAFFSAVYVVDRQTDSMVKEIILPRYDPLDTFFASKYPAMTNALIKDKNGNYYSITSELLWGSRGVANIHCLDSNLNLKWYKFIVDTTSATTIYSSHLIGPSRFLISAFNRTFNGTGTKIKIYATDSSGAIVTNVPNHSSNFDTYTLYPNPTRDVLFINYPSQSNPPTGFIYTLDGKLIKKEKYNPQSGLSLQHLSKGNYIVKFLFEDKSAVSHIVSKE